MANEIIEINERSLRLLKENDEYFDIYDDLFKSMWKYANFLINESNEIRKIKSEKDNYDSDWYRLNAPPKMVYRSTLMWEDNYEEI